MTSVTAYSANLNSRKINSISFTLVHMLVWKVQKRYQRGSLKIILNQHCTFHFHNLNL